MADVDGFPAGAGADPERPGHVEVELPRVASGPWDEVTMLDRDAAGAAGSRDVPDAPEVTGENVARAAAAAALTVDTV